MLIDCIIFILSFKYSLMQLTEDFISIVCTILWRDFCIVSLHISSKSTGWSRVNLSNISQCGHYGNS